MPKKRNAEVTSDLLSNNKKKVYTYTYGKANVTAC